MSVFDIAAILITIAAVSGYVNHRLLRLPPTSGTLFVVLVSSLVVVVTEYLVPSFGLQAVIQRFLGQIDFNQTLMHGLNEAHLGSQRRRDRRTHACGPVQVRFEEGLQAVRRRCQLAPRIDLQPAAQATGRA